MKELVINGSLVSADNDAKGQVAPALSMYNYTNLGVLGGYGLTCNEFRLLCYMSRHMRWNQLWFFFDLAGMRKFADLYEMKHLSGVYSLRDGLIDKGVLIKGERTKYEISKYKYAIDPHAILYCKVEMTVKMKEKWNIAWADLNKDDTK
jgi:hypothetical protein